MSTVRRLRRVVRCRHEDEDLEPLVVHVRPRDRPKRGGVPAVGIAWTPDLLPGFTPSFCWTAFAVSFERPEHAIGAQARHAIKMYLLIMSTLSLLLLRSAAPAVDVGSLIYESAKMWFQYDLLATRRARDTRRTGDGLAPICAAYRSNLANRVSIGRPSSYLLPCPCTSRRAPERLSATARR